MNYLLHSVMVMSEVYIIQPTFRDLFLLPFSIDSSLNVQTYNFNLFPMCYQVHVRIPFNKFQTKI